jgi:hypothetical protein
MDLNQLLAETAHLIAEADSCPQTGPDARGYQSLVAEFLRKFAGPKSAFVTLAGHEAGSAEYRIGLAKSALVNFQRYVQRGLLDEVSPTRKVQLDVVSDFLEQAHGLLQSKGVHPAAAIVL